MRRGEEMVTDVTDVLVDSGGRERERQSGRAKGCESWKAWEIKRRKKRKILELIIPMEAVTETVRGRTRGKKPPERTRP